jgi:hypothetical protein
MKIKNVTKEITFYVELDEEVDDPEFLWYRTNEHGEHWEVLIGCSWEPINSIDELKEAFVQYEKNLPPKRNIMII